MKILMYVLIAFCLFMAIVFASTVDMDGAILCIICIALAMVVSLVLVSGYRIPSHPDEYDRLTA